MITRYGNPDAGTVLIQMVDEHEMEGLEGEIAEIQKRTDRPFSLLAVRIKNWNRDLSPWPAPAVFGREDFGEGAAETLAEVLEACTDPDKTYLLGGYSLAGLFALWAACQTERFKGIAAASPSVWFPGFAEYVRENRIQADAVYLSLGDREERTQNPVMATVGDRIRETYRLLSNQGIRTTLEWNEGNHFRDAGLRIAKAFVWTMEQ